MSWRQADVTIRSFVYLNELGYEDEIHWFSSNLDISSYNLPIKFPALSFDESCHVVHNRSNVTRRRNTSDLMSHFGVFQRDLSHSFVTF